VGEIASPLVALGCLYGIVYHIAGYSHNSYSDWRNGYDEQDVYKQHHPLNTGALSPTRAKYFVIGSIITAMVIALAISYSSPAALAFLFVALLGGIYYNELGKETHLKFIPISFAHTSTFVVPYLGFGGSTDDLAFISGAVVVFLWVVYQISVSGEVKDTDTGEQNLLEHWGLEKAYDELANNAVVTKKVKMYSLGLRLFIGIAALAYLGVTNLNALVGFAIILFTVISLYLNQRMFHIGLFSRKDAIEDMALIEFCSMSIFVLMFTTTVDLFTGLSLISLIVISFLWVRTFNQMLWGTKVAPKV
jgi:hypothetical protein